MQELIAHPLFNHLLLIVVGVVAGTLNVLAGGGSFLTLPTLIFLGLPPSVANGTNRVGIFLQNVSAVASFERQGIRETGHARWTALPATVGGALGAWLSLSIGDRAFQQILSFLMVVVSLWTLWKPAATEPEGDAERTLAPWTMAGGFFLAGIYGGFVQAGVGFLILAVTTAAGLDLVRGNATKVLSILCLTGLALGVFAWQGRVDWILGLTLAVGTMVGGALGARLTVLKGHRWVRRIVTATVVIFAVKLWFSA